MPRTRRCPRCSRSKGRSSARGDLAAARALFERSIALNEKLSGPEHPELAETLVDLGEVARLEGDAAAAADLCRRALAIAEKAHGPDHPDARRAAAALKRVGSG